MTLYARIALLLITFVTISSVTLSWLSYQWRVDDFFRHRTAAAETLTTAIAKSVIADTLEDRPAKVRNTLRSIVQSNAEIRYIVVVGFDKEYFASTYPDELPTELQFMTEVNTAGAYRRLLLDDSTIDDFSYPLITNLDAHVHVGYNTDAFTVSREAARGKMLGLMLGIIVCALLAASPAARHIGNPLRQLARAVRNDNHNHPFDPQSIAKAGPEITVLVDAFVAMAAQRAQDEQDLRIAAAAFESHEGMIVTNAESVILRVNQAFTEISGYRADELVGKNLRVLQSGRHDKAFYRDMWEAIGSTGRWQGEIWDRRKNGEEYPKWLTISAIKDKKGVVTHYIGAQFDITERRKAEDRIKELAYSDTLTGLLSRLSLHERLEQALSLAERNKSLLAVMLIDMDNFKAINDTQGHSAGDLLLIQVARRLSSAVRQSDLVARFGGDEFVVVLPEIDSSADAVNVADKILTAVSASYSIDGQEFRTSPSIGICFYPDDATQSKELIKKADVAMYHAKANGRNNYQFFRDEIQAATVKHIVLGAELS